MLFCDIREGSGSCLYCAAHNPHTGDTAQCTLIKLSYMARPGWQCQPLPLTVWTRTCSAGALILQHGLCGRLPSYCNASLLAWTGRGMVLLACAALSSCCHVPLHCILCTAVYCIWWLPTCVLMPGVWVTMAFYCALVTFDL